MTAEVFVAKAIGIHGTIIGEWRSTSRDGAMSAADRDRRPSWEIVVRGEYTSDGTRHDVGRGRVVAVKSSGEWSTAYP